MPNPAEFSALSRPFFSKNNLGGGKKRNLGIWGRRLGAGRGEVRRKKGRGKKLSMP